MAHDPQQNGPGPSIHWEYFINPNKSASRTFDELCRGLAQVIRRLEPTSNHPDLSPKQLANFYRSCGGNFDELFKNTGEHGLSWIYRTLGCYHSLQPTRNAFEAPSIPCLTEDGYVRWQTLQLLLCPEEHKRLIQRAVELYDVPRRGAAGQFPKTIPNECFPTRPDTELEKWHRFVTSQINQEDYTRRIKLSPYASPQPDGNASPGGYFGRTTQAARQPTHAPRRQSLSEEEIARREAIRRRSSVPDVLSPYGTPPSDNHATMNARSQSANRPGSSGQHQRPRSKNGPPTQHHSSPAQRPSHTMSPRRHESNTSIDRSHRRRDPRRERNVSSGSRPDSADDASSEESNYARKPRSSEEEDSSRRRPRWGTSLMPSFFLSKNQRRHSSDGRVPTLKDDKRSPRRGESIHKRKTEESQQPQGRYTDSPSDRSSSAVRFSGVSRPGEVPIRPEEPAYAPPPSAYRYPETQSNTYQPPHINTAPSQPPPPPTVNYIPPTPPILPSMQPTNAMNNFEARKQNLPLRVTTVGGVGGRRYIPNETMSAIEPNMIRRRDRTSSMRNPATSTVL